MGLALSRQSTLLTLVAVTTLGVSACGGAGQPTGQPGGGGPTTARELTLAINQDEGTLTPYTHVTGYPGRNLTNLIFETLLRLDPDNKIKPLLATSAEPSADSRTFTVPLRSGVKWHDGQPFTGEDVRFSVEYYKKNDVSDSAPEVEGIDRVEAEPDRVVNKSMLTTQHCGPNQDWTTYSNNLFVGRSNSGHSGTDSMRLTGAGYSQLSYVGPWDSSSGRQNNDAADVALNSTICASGALSGEVCNGRVDEVNAFDSGGTGPGFWASATRDLTGLAGQATVVGLPTRSPPPVVSSYEA